MNTYLVTAYRWGDLNGSDHYFVYCGTDEDKALKLAEEERDDRGGKYGVQVVQFNDDGTEYKQVAYHPGLLDDGDAPHHNTRYDMLASLGSSLEEAATRSTFEMHVHNPGEKGSYRIRPMKIKVPRWVRAAYGRAKKHEALMNRIYKR